jgi:hypothetical protein
MQGNKLGTFVLVLALFACKKGQDTAPGGATKEPAPTPPATPAAAAAAPPATPATAAAAPPAVPAPAASVAAPAAAASAAVFDGQYPLDGVNKIAANCAKSQVILTAVTMGALQSTDFQWNFAKQVFLANPQFKIKTPLPSGGDFVNFRVDEHKPTKGAALVAQCTRAETCMQVAAAYKAVVPTSHPEVTCGPTPTLGESIGPALFGSGDLKDELPSKENVVQQCVRLAACTAHRDGKLDGDPAIACQKKPSSFQLRCAFKSTCEQVLSCVDAAAKP